MSDAIRLTVLDHGYVEEVEHWGSDEQVIAAARMSTGGGFKQWEPYEGHPRGDQGLLEYLYFNRHSTPFEMGGLTVEVCAPIMVYRQWHRHRTQSYNEASARYAPLPAVDYLPELPRLMLGGGANKQAGTAKGAGKLNEELAKLWLRDLENHYEEAEKLYQEGLRYGVPKELARLCLPVARYSTMRASANLRNWLGFLLLRLDEHAQWEVRQYARAVLRVLCERFPRTMGLFQADRVVAGLLAEQRRKLWRGEVRKDRRMAGDA